MVGVIGVVIAYNRTAIPQPNELANKQVSIVYYSDGKTELDRIAVQDGNRESVPLSKVPKFVQDAHIAAEDRTFYQNNGISVGGILRAVKTSVTGETQVGGSTITQQYVKNYFLTQDRTISRKAKEILIAVKIDGQLSKSEILEKYLNTIYYGRGAYGIQSAAKAYFGKDVSRLTVGEGAVLASVLNAPSLYDPAQGPDAEANLTKRYAYVLDGMVQEGWLSAADRAKYAALPKILAYKGNKFSSGPQRLHHGAGQERAALDGPVRAGHRQGRPAHRHDRSTRRPRRPRSRRCGRTCPSRCRAASSRSAPVTARSSRCTAVRTTPSRSSTPRPRRSCRAPRTSSRSRCSPPCAAASRRRRGSTATSPRSIDGTTITNFGGRSYGMVDMRRMVGRSINTAFVNLNNTIGPALTRQAAIDAGIPEKTPGLDDHADQRPRHRLAPRHRHGHGLLDDRRRRACAPSRTSSRRSPRPPATSASRPSPQTKRAFDKDVTADVTDAMTYTVKTGGTATKLQRLDRPVAGKTGTSSYAKSIWFSGFVPQLAVSIGMYKPDAQGNPQTLTSSEDTNLTGGTVPADVFYDFMKVALEGMEVQDFPARAGVGDDKIPAPTTTFTPPPSTTFTPAPTTTTQAPTTTTTQAPSTTTSRRRRRRRSRRDAGPDDDEDGPAPAHHGHTERDAAAGAAVDQEQHPMRRRRGRGRPGPTGASPR